MNDVKTIRLTKETYEKLILFKSRLEAKKCALMSLDDVVAELLKIVEKRLKNE